MQDAIKQVMAQILEVEITAIDADSSPESIDSWDSLKHMQLIMALEDEFGIEFPDDAIPELVRFSTIEITLQQLTSA
ncbi:MAG: acyl carrier protein [Gammaproteobacteria bacterium]|nr:acyl carrier protein [Gammaproteobacteria bacterium]NNL99126.1 acyl carrier protein [Gammaproteobacteria bacterium]